MNDGGRLNRPFASRRRVRLLSPQERPDAAFNPVTRARFIVATVRRQLSPVANWRCRP